MKSSVFAWVGLSALAVFAFAQDGTLLRRELKEGAVDTYKVEFTNKQTVYAEQLGGEQQFDVSGKMLYATKVGKFDSEKKVSDLEVKISKLRFELGGMAQMMQGQLDQLPKEIVYTAKVDDRNRVSALKIDPKLGQFAGMMEMMGASWNEFTVLPEQAVKSGDVWDFAVPKLPAYGNKEFKLKAKYSGDKLVGNTPAIVITLDGVLPMDMDLSTMMNAAGGGEGAGGGAKLTGPIDYHMEAVFEKATGRLLEMKSSGKGKQKLDLPAAGTSMDVSGEATAKMTLVPPGLPGGAG